MKGRPTFRRTTLTRHLSSGWLDNHFQHQPLFRADPYRVIFNTASFIRWAVPIANGKYPYRVKLRKKVNHTSNRISDLGWRCIKPGRSLPAPKRQAQSRCGYGGPRGHERTGPLTFERSQKRTSIKLMENTLTG